MSARNRLSGGGVTQAELAAAVANVPTSANTVPDISSIDDGHVLTKTGLEVNGVETPVYMWRPLPDPPAPIAWTFSNNGLDWRQNDVGARANNLLPNLVPGGTFSVNPPVVGAPGLSSGALYVKHGFLDADYFVHDKTRHNGVILTPQSGTDLSQEQYNGVITIDEDGFYDLHASGTLKCAGTVVQQNMHFGLVSIVKLRDTYNAWDGEGTSGSNTNGGEAPTASQLGGTGSATIQYVDDSGNDNEDDEGVTSWMNMSNYATNLADPPTIGLIKSGFEICRGYSEGGLKAEYANLVAGNRSAADVGAAYASLSLSQAIHVSVSHKCNLEAGDRLAVFFAGALHAGSIKSGTTPITESDGDITITRRTLSWTGHRIGEPI